HPIELDRVLGTELSLAGGSFLTLERQGHFRYGSPIVHITADATIPGGRGSFGYDDEGVPAQRYDIVKDGIFVGYLSSRETAPIIGATSGGAMRASGWNCIPLIRMTNVNLEPGKGSLKDLISDTKKGLLMDSNRVWSIDDRRMNFQFGCEIAWEIKNGKLGRVLKNPAYRGITPEFWSRCDAICGTEDWRVWGISNCGKGEPMQTIGTGHGAAPCRFNSVHVGAEK
ncbi:MAG TPA: TldD/PmbA family protein, partial [bacterium]|nr:TldD/PmbA family protein [bacterium]